MRKNTLTRFIKKRERCAIDTLHNLVTRRKVTCTFTRSVQKREDALIPCRSPEKKRKDA